MVVKVIVVVVVLVGGCPTIVVVVMVTITPPNNVSEHESIVVVAWGDSALSVSVSVTTTVATPGFEIVRATPAPLEAAVE